MANILDRPIRSPVEFNVLDTRLPGVLVPPLAFGAIPPTSTTPQQWVLEGMLGRGIVTMMTSLWKAGKTTFVGNVVRAMHSGQTEFIGLPLRSVPTLIITEEILSLWADRLQELPRNVPVYFASRPFLGRPSPAEWKNYIVQLACWVEANNVGLIVVDPIANLIPGEENVSGAMLDFLLPLTAFTQRDVAVWLLHHPRKSDGGEGRAARGSGALPGFVDIMLEMRRHDGDPATRVRRLVAYSRYGETPPELTIELAEDGLSYKRLTSTLAASLSYLGKTILSVLVGCHEALTVQEIAHNWPMGHEQPNIRSLHNVLRAGLNYWWVRIGNGNRSSPYRYRPMTLSDRPPMANDSEDEGTQGAD